MERRIVGESDLRKLKPLLPVYAAQAAAEIDNHLRGVATTFETVAKVAALLTSKKEDQTPTPAQRALSGVGTELIMRDALRYLQPDSHIRTLNELWKMVDAKAVLLEGLDESTSPTDLEDARDFCSQLALSAASASYSVSESPKNAKYDCVP